MENYPIYEILKRYKPISSIVKDYNISKEEIDALIAAGKLDYTLFKEPGKFKRTPHVDIEKLLKLIGGDKLE